MTTNIVSESVGKATQNALKNKESRWKNDGNKALQM